MKHQKCMQKFSNEQYRINCPPMYFALFIIEIKAIQAAKCNCALCRFLCSCEYYFVENLVEEKVSSHYVESSKTAAFILRCCWKVIYDGNVNELDPWRNQ